MACFTSQYNTIVFYDQPHTRNVLHTDKKTEFANIMLTCFDVFLLLTLHYNHTIIRSQLRDCISKTLTCLQLLRRQLTLLPIICLILHLSPALVFALFCISSLFSFFIFCFFLLFSFFSSLFHIFLFSFHRSIFCVPSDTSAKGT